jgi:AMME syndrome candidate gene 1 protein
MGRNKDDKAVQGDPPLSGTTTVISSSSSAPSSSSTPSCSHQNSTITVNDTEEYNLIATPSMCYHCFDTLIDELQHETNNTKNRSSFFSNHQHTRTNAATTTTTTTTTTIIIPNLESQDLPNDGTMVECPLFVTWEKTKKHDSKQHHHHHHHHQSWQLRGCIGTLTPRVLDKAVREYALTSALRDKRFRPIELHEITSLRVSISLLVQYEECTDVFDWTVGVHGIVIKFSVPDTTHHHKYNATYLPEVAVQLQWDQSQTIMSLIQKAGYHGTVDEEFLKSIHCTRYQSSKCQVTYDEYVLHHCQGNDPLPQPLPPQSPPQHRVRQSISSWTTSSSSCINM